MSEPLEAIVEQESRPAARKKWYKDKQWYVDTLSMVTWGAAVGLPIKLFAIGMTWPQTLVSMLGDFGVNASCGGIYGKYLDFCYRKQGLTPESKGVRKYLTDLFAFNTFWQPVVSGVLYGTGLVTGKHLTPTQYLINLGVGTALTTFIAPANRWYVHTVRRMFGIAAENAPAAAPALNNYRTPASS